MIRADADHLVVGVAETLSNFSPSTGSIFTLGARGRILDASFSGNMATAHRTLERTGHLGHSFSQAERDALKNVRVITGTSLQ